jgi:exosortase/archaeosortase family protein
VERTFILPLREGIAMVVAEISNLAGHPALAAGTSVRLAGGWVGIDEACGGIRSLQASVLIALFFGEWLRLGWGRRVALLIGGAGAAVVGNFGRVLFLSWAAEQGTLERWHDPAGWVALGFSLVVTGLLGWWLRPAAQGGGAVSARKPVATLAVGVPPVAWRGWLVTVIVMLGAIELGARTWYAWGEVKAAEVPQWTVRFPETNPTLRRLPLSDAAREMLRPDVFESVTWRGPGQLECMANYIVWEQGQMARSAPFLHNPTTCLPYSGCELAEDLGLLVVRWSQGEIPFHAYVFRRMNEDLVVAFALWDPVQGKPLMAQKGGWSGWWRAQWRDVAAARQHQPGQMLAFAMVGREHQDRLADQLTRLIVPIGELK